MKILKFMWKRSYTIMGIICFGVSFMKANDDPVLGMGFMILGFLLFNMRLTEMALEKLEEKNNE